MLFWQYLFHSSVEDMFMRLSRELLPFFLDDSEMQTISGGKMDINVQL
jgi:hypothetical protein